jgi:FAD:protein FMN transferase
VNAFKHIRLWALFVAAVLIISSCAGGTKPVSESKVLLGTFCNITIYDRVKSSVFDTVFERISEIHDKMSTTISSSEVEQVNAQAGIEPVNVSPDTFTVIQRGLYYSELTKGRFDITIGPLVKLWGIGTEYAKVPNKEEIQELLPLVDYRKVEIDPKEQTVFLQEKGMRIDLGGIAKGYAADEAKRILLELGIKHAIIDFGGNISTVGKKPGASVWKIGIQNPEEGRGRFLGIARVVDKSIVTSGIYERFFIKDDKRYHHILDTETGYPVENGLASVSVITEEGIYADAISTSLFALGLKDGREIVEKREELEAIFVTRDNKVSISKGIEEIFSIESPDYSRFAENDISVSSEK